MDLSFACVRVVSGFKFMKLRRVAGKLKLSVSEGRNWDLNEVLCEAFALLYFVPVNRSPKVEDKEG